MWVKHFIRRYVIQIKEMVPTNRWCVMFMLFYFKLPVCDYFKWNTDTSDRVFNSCDIYLNKHSYENESYNYTGIS